MRANEALASVAAGAQGNIQNRQSNGSMFPSTAAQLSLLSDSSYPQPRLPTSNNLTFVTLSLLKDGRSLSADMFHTRTDSHRLAAYIHILRRLGWCISSNLDACGNAHYKLSMHSLVFLQDYIQSQKMGWRQ